MQIRTLSVGPQVVWSDGATTLFHPTMAPMSGSRFVPPPFGSTLQDAVTLGRVPCCDDCVTARPFLPPLSKGLSSLHRQPRLGVGWVPRPAPASVRPRFARPAPTLPWWRSELASAARHLQQWSGVPGGPPNAASTLHSEQRRRDAWRAPSQPPSWSPARGGGLCGPVPRQPPVHEIPASIGTSGRSGWATLATIGVPPGSTVDIWFSAGKRENWGIDGTQFDDPEGDDRRASYRSCDAGNVRNCEVWRVRWTFGQGLRGAKAERVIPKSTHAHDDDEPVGSIQAAVSLSDRFLAYRYFDYASANIYSTKGTQAIYTHVIDPTHTSMEYDVADPPSYGGAVAWPAWLGRDTLLTSTEYRAGSGGDDIEDYAYISTWQTPLMEVVTGARAAGDASPLRGPDAIFALFPLTDVPNLGLSEAFATLPLASDPHAHDAVLYDGEDRGARVVTFGSEHYSPNGHDDRAVPRVLDPAVADPAGVAWEQAHVPAFLDSDGMHWDLTGLVADALGMMESPDDHTKNVFAIYPTCGELTAGSIIPGGQLGVIPGEGPNEHDGG